MFYIFEAMGNFARCWDAADCYMSKAMIGASMPREHKTAMGKSFGHPLGAWPSS